MPAPATAAALRVAADHGYVSDAPLVLQDTNNTVVWLRPDPVVAKVGTRAHSAEALAREHAVATARASWRARRATGGERGADARRSLGLPRDALVARRARRCVGRHARDVATSIARLHDELARYEGELPSFRAGIARARTAHWTG